MPERRTQAMRVFVDPGDYTLGNLGDVAMLQVALRRLRANWPDAGLDVLVRDAQLAGPSFHGAEPVPYQGMADWFAERAVLGSAYDRLAPGLRAGVRGLQRAARTSWPGLFETAMRVRTSRSPSTAEGVRRFLLAARGATLHVVAGQGTFTDHARIHAMDVLNLLDLMERRGIPTALLGQGIGPLTDTALRARMARVFGRAQFIALREGRFSPGLVAELGIPPERVQVTGDDAIELAFEARPERPGTDLGVNLRIARSAGTTDDAIVPVRAALARFIRQHGISSRAVPIAKGPSGDAVAISGVLAGTGYVGDGGASLLQPIDCIREVGRCRILVTGAYHAAVFALSQGVPTACLAASQYFSDKFDGLRAQFGPGCEVVPVGGDDFTEHLTAVMNHLWDDAETLRAPLLAAARAQVESSRAAYARVAQLSSRQPVGGRR